jgi:hypothetical protein
MCDRDKGSDQNLFQAVMSQPPVDESKKAALDCDILSFFEYSLLGRKG